MSYIPVYEFIGNNNKPIDVSSVLKSNMQYYDAISGEQLTTPPKWGDFRSDGQKFHVGNKIGNIISYHGVKNW